MKEIDFGKYDREGLEILAQTQHDQLEAQDEQLAELRALHSRTLTVYGVWDGPGGDPAPQSVGVTDDGEDVQLRLDVTPLIEGVEERARRAAER